MGFNNFYMTYSAEKKAGKQWNPYTKKVQNYVKPAYVKPAYVKPAYVKPAYVKPAYVKPAKPAYVKPAKPAYVKPAYVAPKNNYSYYNRNSGSNFSFTYRTQVEKNVQPDEINLAADIPEVEEVDTDYVMEALILASIVVSVYAISTQCKMRKDAALGVDRDDMYQQSY